jgi:hypothetical protein
MGTISVCQIAATANHAHGRAWLVREAPGNHGRRSHLPVADGPQAQVGESADRSRGGFGSVSIRVRYSSAPQRRASGGL